MGIDVGAFVGAAERNGNIASDAEATGLCQGDDGAGALEGLGDGAVGVGAGESFSGGGEERDFVGVGGRGRVKERFGTRLTLRRCL